MEITLESSAHLQCDSLTETSRTELFLGIFSSFELQKTITH